MQRRLGASPRLTMLVLSYEISVPEESEGADPPPRDASEQDGAQRPLLSSRSTRSLATELALPLPHHLPEALSTLAWGAGPQKGLVLADPLCHQLVSGHRC